MSEALKFTFAVELAWVIIEIAAMALFAACYTIHVKRIRLAQLTPAAPAGLASVICIDRH